MSLKEYLKDKLFFIFVSFLTLILLFALFFSFKINKPLFIMTFIILIISFLILLFYDYFRKKDYYNQLLNNIKKLDKAYLVLETLLPPDFYDGKILCDALYDINKSMIEEIKEIKNKKNDFKEYIEMWIHEVKIPLSTAMLISHNKNKEIDSKVIEQIKRIDSYVDQILYYTRSENPENDYIIKKINLSNLIRSVALKNKDEILANKIDFIVTNVNYEVTTDNKWLEFILNQIINNSIKYKKDIKDSYIKISAEKDNNLVKLFIEDNGIGIPKEDIKRVFNKSFTGYNGRIKTKSTGMGLYIAKKLCTKLGHSISIESVKDEYTKVCITFNNDDFYNVVN